jgi:aldehyde:ferredoxin oxidoreductase
MATKLGGYTGKIVKINLNNREISEYPISDKDRKLFLGGKILAARIIFDYIKAPIDPLSEENLLVVTTCPLNGTGSPSSSRFNVSTISPLTNILTSSNCGGNFGLSLKRAGYDALILTGKSEEFIYIEITENEILFHNAEHLRDKLTSETQEIIGGKSGKLVIGPAGEHMVRYACAISADRAAGRGGVGAVMGSKNVKALTAEGRMQLSIYNADKLNKIKKQWTLRLRAHPLTGKQLPKLGTAGLLSTMQQKNILATKNFSAGKFDGYRSISGEEMAEKFLIKNKGCLTCPIQCARVVDLDGKSVKGPEVEIMGLLGANILNDNLHEIIKWNYELDELGMDTISTSGSIAFAMELQEKGIWDSGLEFGKIDNISQIIHEIAFRNSEVGDLLANGSRELSNKFGGKEYCIQSKGMELSAYEPRGAVGQGLGYSVANRGGCHLNAGYEVVLEGLGLNIDPLTTHGKAQLGIMFQNLMEGASAGGSCLFTTYAFFPFFLISKPNSLVTRMVNFVFPYLGPVLKIINKFPGLVKINLRAMLPHPLAISYATGMKLTMGELMKIGSRGFNLERLINTRLGISAKDDKLPKRLTDEEQIPGNKRTKVPQEKMKKQFYRGRGWDKNGLLRKSTLHYYKINNLDADNIQNRPIEVQETIKVIPPKPKKEKPASKTPDKKTIKDKK